MNPHSAAARQLRRASTRAEAGEIISGFRKADLIAVLERIGYGDCIGSRDTAAALRRMIIDSVGAREDDAAIMGRGWK